MKQSVFCKQVCRAAMLGAVLVAGARPAMAVNAVFAGRASSIDSANTEPYQQGALEADVTYLSSGQTNDFDCPLSVVYGLFPRVEISGSVDGQVEGRPGQTVGGVSDVNLGAKAKLLDQERFWATQGFEFAAKLPIASRDRGLGTGRTDYDLTWLVSKDFTDRLTGHFNIGRVWIGNPPGAMLHDELHYGIAADFAWTDHLSLSAQLFASSPLGAEQNTGLGVNGGVSWQLSTNFELHGLVSVGLRGVTPSVTSTVGVTWSFGRLH